jgi:hypothetical protein
LYPWVYVAPPLLFCKFVNQKRNAFSPRCLKKINKHCIWKRQWLATISIRLTKRKKSHKQTNKRYNMDTWGSNAFRSRWRTGAFHSIQFSKESRLTWSTVPFVLVDTWHTHITNTRIYQKKERNAVFTWLDIFSGTIYEIMVDGINPPNLGSTSSIKLYW